MYRYFFTYIRLLASYDPLDITCKDLGIELPVNISMRKWQLLNFIINRSLVLYKLIRTTVLPHSGGGLAQPVWPKFVNLAAL